MSCIALVGTLCGQITFGVLGDRLGRKGAYGVTLGLMIVMTILQVVGAWGSQDLFTALFLLWRFWLGVGIGGDYPLSAVISSEYASTRLRGPMIAAVILGTSCSADFKFQSGVALAPFLVSGFGLLFQPVIASSSQHAPKPGGVVGWAFFTENAHLPRAGVLGG